MAEPCDDRFTSARQLKQQLEGGGLIDYTELAPASQRVFMEIEAILGRYSKEEMTITKEDLMYHCMMSKTTVRNALGELKKTGYIVNKNSNSPIMRIGEEYKYGGKKGE